MNGGFIEMTERALETQGMLEVTKYRHHWQGRDGLLIKRWDNAPHHPLLLRRFRIICTMGLRIG